MDESAPWFGHVLCRLIHLVLEYGIKRLNDARRMPPFWRLDSIGNCSHLPTPLCLYFAYWAEPTGWKSFLEFAIIEGDNVSGTGEWKSPKKDIRGYAMIRVVVRFKGGKQSLSILLSLLLRGDNARWW